MRIFIERDIVCKDPQDCWDSIVKSIETDYPFSDGNGNRTSHLSINHEPNAHQIWLFYYDTDGKFESDIIDDVTKQIRTKIQDRATIRAATKRPSDKNEVETKIVAELMKNPNIVVK